MYNVYIYIYIFQYIQTGKKNKHLNKPTIAIFDLNIKINDKKITIKMTVLQQK